MKKIAIITALLLCWFHVFSQIKIYDSFDNFEQDYLKNLSEDTVYVVNFWATWCVPCVAELPFFEAINKKNKGKYFKMVLVSMDSPKTLETRVLPFLSKNNIETNVILLADSKTYKWIDSVDPNWSGAIPITLFLKGEKKHFYEKDYESIEEIEEDILKLNH